MKQRKETFTKAGAGMFRAIADLMDAAHVFYEAGYPDEGDKTVAMATEMVSTIPEMPE